MKGLRQFCMTEASHNQDQVISGVRLYEIVYMMWGKLQISKTDSQVACYMEAKLPDEREMLRQNMVKMRTLDFSQLINLVDCKRLKIIKFYERIIIRTYLRWHIIGEIRHNQIYLGLEKHRKFFGKFQIVILFCRDI